MNEACCAGGGGMKALNRTAMESGEHGLSPESRDELVDGVLKSDIEQTAPGCARTWSYGRWYCTNQNISNGIALGKQPNKETE